MKQLRITHCALLIALLMIFCTVQADAKINLQYQVHVQNIGWTGLTDVGKVAGTTGRSLGVEAVTINFFDGAKSMVQYSAHVQNIGWQTWQNAGAVAGTVGKNLRLEALRIQLANGYERDFDIYYRTHVQDYGWLGWAKNGEPAGTSGASLRLEALQIALVKKGENFQRDSKPAYLEKKVRYRGAVDA